MKSNSASQLSLAVGLLAAGLLATLVATPASSQEAAFSPWLNVVIVRVQPSRVADFEDRMKEFMAAQQAAGRPTGQVFQVAVGNLNEFHLVSPRESMAENDEQEPPPMEPAEMARWVMRMFPTLQSVRSFVARTYPQHGVEGDGSAGPPPLLFLRSVQIVQGRESDYENWVANQYMPALRQTDVQGHTMSRSAFGESTSNFYHAHPLGSWAELDAPDPLMEILGERRYEQVFGQLDGLVERHEIIIARPRMDLMGET